MTENTIQPVLSDRQALVVLAILPLLFMAQPLLSPDSLLSVGRSDLDAFFMPAGVFIRNSVAAGSFPWWNSTMMAGYPAIGDIQLQLFYPPTWILLPFSPQYALTLLLTGHLVFTGAGFFVWLRTLKCKPEAALFGAIAWSFSGFQVTHLASAVTIPCAAAWIPWIMVSGWRLWDKPGLITACTLAATMALQTLAGFPQVTYFTAWLLAATLAGRLLSQAVQHNRPACAHVSPIGWLAAAAVITLLLTAVQLVPMLEFSANSTRTGGVPFTFATEFAMPLQMLAGVVAPEYWRQSGHGAAMPDSYLEALLYLGLLPLLSILAGLRRGPRAYVVAAWTAAAVLCTATAIARDLPIYGWLFPILPMFNYFAVPARLVLPATFCLATAAAIGFPTLVASVSAGSHRQVGILIAAAIIPAVLIVISPAGYLLPLLTVLVLVFWMAAAPKLPHRLVCLSASFILATELAAFGSSWIGTSPAAAVSEVALPAWLPALPPDQEPARILAGRNGNLAIQNQSLENLAGYNPMQLQRYAHYMAFSQNRDSTQPIRQIAIDTLANIHMLDHLNLTWIVTPQRLPENPRFELVHEPGPVPGDTYIYRNTHTLPRAWYTANAHAAPAEVALQALSDVEYTPQNGVFMETTDPLPLPQQLPWQAAVTTETGSGQRRVSVQAPAEGFIVLAENWLPGWQAVVNGKPAVVYRANFLFCAVKVPAGKVTIDFRYIPRGFWLAAACSVIGWFALLTLAGGRFLKKYRRR